MSTPHRKLTTIVSADVQGYSRLMEADEEGTLATLRQYREAMARLIESYAGRVVNTWGDGLIAEFPSVIEAVRAAVDIQNELAERNASRPTETRMHFRIGINLGDVIAEGDDIYGEGVNIAARLQASAPPGGIVISDIVHHQVRNKVAVGFEFLGDLSVKNIGESVPSYLVRIGGQGDAAPVELGDQPRLPPASTGRQASTSAGTRFIGRHTMNRTLVVLALIMAASVAINLLSWEGEFWAAWPLLAFAVLVGLIWAKTTNRVDRSLAMLGVIGLGIIAINMLSWSGRFWARWPLIGIALAGALLWILRRGSGDRHAR